MSGFAPDLVPGAEAGVSSLAPDLVPGAEAGVSGLTPDLVPAAEPGVPGLAPDFVPAAEPGVSGLAPDLVSAAEPGVSGLAPDLVPGAEAGASGLAPDLTPAEGAPLSGAVAPCLAPEEAAWSGLALDLTSGEEAILPDSGLVPGEGVFSLTFGFSAFSLFLVFFASAILNLPSFVTNVFPFFLMCCFIVHKHNHKKIHFKKFHITLMFDGKKWNGKHHRTVLVNYECPPALSTHSISVQEVLRGWVYVPLPTWAHRVPGQHCARLRCPPRQLSFHLDGVRALHDGRQLRPNGCGGQVCHRGGLPLHMLAKQTYLGNSYQRKNN